MKILNLFGPETAFKNRGGAKSTIPVKNMYLCQAKLIKNDLFLNQF